LPVLFVIFIVFALIYIIFLFIANKVEDFFYATSPFWHFCGDNIFLLFAFALLFLAGLSYIYFKPHPAENHFKSYKKGEITRRQAIEDIATTMYNPKRNGIPPVYKSKSIERRIQALRKRVRAEADFIEELIRYLKAKSMLE
jgi:hypothetical protein